MFLWGLVALIGAALTFVGYYSWPYWFNELGPDGDVTISLIPQLAGMIIEIVAIVKLVELFADRKWHHTRDRIVADILQDAKIIVDAADRLIIRKTNEEDMLSLLSPEDAIRDLRKQLSSSRLADRLQYMNVAFTPEMAEFIAQHMMLRDNLRDDLIDHLDDSDIVKLTEPDASGTWSLEQLVSRDIELGTEPLVIEWFQYLHRFADGLLQTQTASWRESRLVERIREKLVAIRNATTLETFESVALKNAELE